MSIGAGGSIGPHRRPAINKKEIAKIKAAVHQFLIVAAVVDHDSHQYRERYESLMRRINELDADGRKARRRKVREWRQQLEEVKPHG